jgi:hypothetical protein
MVVAFVIVSGSCLILKHSSGSTEAQSTTATRIPVTRELASRGHIKHVSG